MRSAQIVRHPPEREVSQRPSLRVVERRWVDRLLAAIVGVRAAQLSSARARHASRAPTATIRAKTALDDELRSLLIAVNEAILHEQERSSYRKGFGCSTVLVAVRGDEVERSGAMNATALVVRVAG